MIFEPGLYLPADGPAPGNELYMAGVFQLPPFLLQISAGTVFSVFL